MYVSEQFELKEGMTVWALPGGNASRHWNREPIKATVVSVKRKYFYVRPVDSTGQTWKFFREDNTFCDETDSNNTYAVYISKEAAQNVIQCEQEFREIQNILSNVRGDVNASLGYETVHAIYEILKSKEE